MNKYLTTKEAQQYLSCGRTFLYNLRRKKVLSSSKIGGKNYFKVEELDSLIEKKAC